MSGAHSISTRRAYGVQRICRVWEQARSSVYARRHATKSRPRRCRRGPVGAAPDAVLVGHIRRVLETSPFHGEGVPQSLGEAAGRGDPHLEGAGAAVNAGARPPGPATAWATRTARRHTTARSPRRPPIRCGERT